MEYLSEKYHNPHKEEGEGLPSGEDFFRFEKNNEIKIFNLLLDVK